ncbi:MAG TPA: ATP-dependent DNA helicase RecG [Frankiaceae bacterium]|nr:ATP-dependent DNA helicase RecG [Frankiaceae bacterium]
MGTSDPTQLPLKELLAETTAQPLFEAFGMLTVGDLLEHLPRRYDKRGELTDFSDLREGEVATVSAMVDKIDGRFLHQRRLNMLQVDVSSGRDKMQVTFFSKRKLTWKLAVGRQATFSGKVGIFRDRWKMTNPEVDMQDEGDDFAGALRPVYPATGTVESKAIRTAVQVVLDVLGPLPDPLPDVVRKAYGLVSLEQAYRLVHRPQEMSDVSTARERLKWDEALVLQVALAQRRLAAERAPAVPRTERPGGLLAAFDASLPFTLTDGQKKVGKRITEDLAHPHPMQRLLQGEVGSGKTVVALRAMLTVVDAGGQAALLAPTEVLANQHLLSLRTLLGDLAEAGTLGAAESATNVVLVTGSQSTAARRKALLAAADGSAGIVVGTHALLSEGVQFADLGLVVVDEQHRFGVEQRDTLRERTEGSGRNPPHLLVMTATPIPRTVAMTVFGDLETSTLTELPAGRTPIKSYPAPTSLQYRIWRKVIEEVAAGHQAFVVCPRIGDKAAEDDEPEGELDDEGSAKRPPLAVVDVVPRLRDGPLKGIELDVLHGRLSADDKDVAMRKFVQGETSVLVATTMVEVGVDVPNASVMVILDADRFGISQLHQLRGRVGRGSAASWCFLATDAEEGSPAFQRVEEVAKTLDGAALARLDLKMRREGDVLGAAQSGRKRSLRLLNLLTDESLLLNARSEAEALVRADPELNGYPLLARVVEDRVGEQGAAFLEKA